MIIRDEVPADHAAIRNVTFAAFDGRSYSDGTEHLVIDRLRNVDVLTISLVAEVEGEILGHAAFSPVTLSDGAEGWFGLGPVSVQPGYQRQGIGGALILAGIERLRAMNAAGCVVLGDPGYYSRLGFSHDPALVYPDVAPQYFLSLVLSGPSASGIVRFHPGFYTAQT